MLIFPEDPLHVAIIFVERKPFPFTNGVSDKMTEKKQPAPGGAEIVRPELQVGTVRGGAIVGHGAAA